MVRTLSSAGLITTALLLFVWQQPARAENMSLAQLIARAAPGSTVTVPPGVHYGSLRIDKPLTLVGAKGAVIDGQGRGDVIRVVAPSVTIRHLAIRNSGVDLTAMNAGIYLEKGARNAVVANNILDGVLFGVYLDGPDDVKVIANKVHGIKRLRRADRGDGIHLWNDHATLIQENDVSETRDGIYIYISPESRIIGNRIHDVRYGIHYMYSNHDVVADNVSFHNRAGYALMQSDHLDAHNNISRNDQAFGFLLNYVTYSTITRNRISGVTGEKGFGGYVIPGAAGKGIFVYNSEFDHFQGNRISDCPIGIHVTAGSDHDIFVGNSFVHNRVQVKYVQNKQEEWSWHGKGNYWSDYLGWDLNGDGYGDVPYRPNDGIDVLLWEYPEAHLLMSSPAILALRYVQEAFPIFTPPGVQDSHPIMKRPAETMLARRDGVLHAVRN